MAQGRKVPINHQLRLLEGLQRCRQRAPSLFQPAKLPLTLACTACLSPGPKRGRQHSLDGLGTNGISSFAIPQKTVSSKQEYGEVPGRRI